MNTLRLVSVFLQFLFFNSLFAQGDAYQSFLKPIPKEILPQNTTAKDSLVLWQEQVVLQLNKNTVKPKEPLFFKAYVLTGPGQWRVSASKVLKVELLDVSGKLIKSQYHKIVDGVSNGSIEIPKKADAGEYYFRAYTRWMMNYGPNRFAVDKIQVGNFKQAVELIEAMDNTIQSYPEGGYLVAGLQNRIAIRGTTDLENLKIVDALDNKVAAVTSFQNGVAMATLTPERGQYYFLKTNDGRTYDLPKPVEEGVTLLANNIDPLNAQLRIEVSPKLAKEKLFLKGTAKGITYFERALDFKSKPVVELEVPKEGVPKGVLTLMVIDEFEQVWAERPINVENDKLKIEIEPSNDQASSINNDLFKVKVTDNLGRPVETELSLGIKNYYKNDQIEQGFTKEFVAHDNPRSQRFINDLLLLTEQSFNVGSSLPDSGFPTEIYYDFQEGLEFYGQAYDLDNTLLANTKIQILITAENDVIANEVTTNSEGMFKLSDLQIEGEADMIFRTVGKETKNKMVKVIPYEYEVPPIAENVPKNKNVGSTNQPNNRGNRPDVTDMKIDSSDRLIVLEGVTLIEDKSVETYSRPSVYGIEPTRVVYQDLDQPKTIPQLLLGIPGVQVSGLGDLEPRLSIPRSAGAGPLLWVVDGLPLSQEPVMATTPLAEVMSIIPYIDIERIEVLFGPDASIYGSRAAGGAILLYTRSGNFDDYLNRKEAQLTYQGFHQSIDFDAYHDEISQKNKKSKGFLYWNPNLKTDANGEALIRFSKSNERAKLKIEAITITQDGSVGKLAKVF